MFNRCKHKWEIIKDDVYPSKIEEWKIRTYEPEIKMALNKLVDLGVDMNKRAFDGYINAGFTREEALALVISSNNQIKQGFQNMKSFGGMK